VRPGAVRARRDHDRESQALGAELVEQDLHPPGEVALGAADELLLRKPLVDPVGDPRGRPDRAELRLVLDGPQRLDEPAARNELCLALGERLPRAVRERARLEADPSREELREVRVQAALQELDLDTFHGPRALRVAEVREQPDAVGLDEESRIGADETGQVADVRGRADEQRLLERLAQPVDALVHRVPARNSSASR
jgi:hypothetical protein